MAVCVLARSLHSISLTLTPPLNMIACHMSLMVNIMEVEGQTNKNCEQFQPNANKQNEMHSSQTKMQMENFWNSNNLHSDGNGIWRKLSLHIVSVRFHFFGIAWIEYEWSKSYSAKLHWDGSNFPRQRRLWIQHEHDTNICMHMKLLHIQSTTASVLKLVRIAHAAGGRPEPDTTSTFYFVNVSFLTPPPFNEDQLSPFLWAIRINCISLFQCIWQCKRSSMKWNRIIFSSKPRTYSPFYLKNECDRFLPLFLATTDACKVPENFSRNFVSCVQCMKNPNIHCLRFQIWLVHLCVCVVHNVCISSRWMWPFRSMR